MTGRNQLGLILLVAAACIACAPARAQSSGQSSATPPADDSKPCTVAPQPVPCTATPATKPTAAERFPFPGETSAAPNSPAPKSDASTPDAPGASPAPKKPASEAFPFPEADGKSVSPDAGDSSSSSSSSSGDNPFPTDDKPGDTANDPPDASGLRDKDTAGAPGRHLLHRVNPIGTKLETPDEREAEDLDIAEFYTQSGDFHGAYLRGQDAVKLKPDDPDAHFALAEAAQKLNKRDEAVAEYNACLKLDPIPKEASAARKALARLKQTVASK